MHPRGIQNRLDGLRWGQKNGFISGPTQQLLNL